LNSSNFPAFSCEGLEMKEEKAVSEVVGNLLILLIVGITVSAMLSYGYPLIMSGQENVKMRNVVSSLVFTKEKMDVVASDVAPSTTVKFPPSGGGISVSNGYELFVYRNGTPLSYIPSSPKELVYVSGNRKLALELGGVWKIEGAMSTLIYPPLVSSSKSPSSLAIDVYELNGSGSAGGYGIATIFMRYAGEETHSYGSSDVKLVIVSEFAEAWAKYLEEQGFSVTLSGNTVTADIKVGNFTIAVHRIDISIW